MQAKLRDLRLDEVEFTVEVEPDDCVSPEGNVSDSGDSEADEAAEREVLERLAAGDYHAWCRLVVRASWEGFEYVDSVGGCVLAEGECPEKHAFEVLKMREEALAGLNQSLAVTFGTLLPLAEDSCAA